MSLRFGSASSDEDESTITEDRTMYSRHTTYQTQMLEAFYREYPEPNDQQRMELSREIGLDVKQIKYWYQNKRAITKGQVDRADNSVLREENERISNENNALKEALNTILCSDCGGPSLSQHQRDSNLDKLLTDNANLKQEYWRISKMIAKYTGQVPLLQVDSPFTRTTPSSVVMNNHHQAADVMMMNNNNYNNVHQDSGIFGIPTSSATLAPPLMNGGQEQVMESDNNNNGPNPLAELMKLLA